MNEPQKTLIDHYGELPKDVQGAIFSTESAEVIQKIGQEHKLNVRQIGILADETGLLMLGINKPRDFVKNLNKRLETDKDTTQKIAQEINARIFAKIRESLRKVHGISPEKTEEQKEDKRSLPSEVLAKEEEPISHIIKPRTAPFAVSQKKPEIEEATAPMKEHSTSAPINLPIKEEKKEETSKPPSAKASEGKDIFEERKKEEGFRSKPSFTEVKLPKKKPGYKGLDPYREPTD